MTIPALQPYPNVSDASLTGAVSVLKDMSRIRRSDQVLWQKLTAGGGNAIATGGTSIRSIADMFGDALNPMDFGAVGDGVTDDTAAFQAALTYGKPIYLPAPPVAYIVGDCKLPSYSAIYSFNSTNYFTVGSKVIVRRKAGCTNVFDAYGNTEIFMSGFTIDGVDRTCNGLGSTLVGTYMSGISLFNMDFHNCQVGISGNWGGGYIEGIIIHGGQFYGNFNHIVNPIDCTAIGTQFSAALDDGISHSSGADGNTYIGCRVEWNQGNGMSFYDTEIINIVGGLFDRNYKAGLWFGDSGPAPPADHADRWIAVTGVQFRRNGRNGTSGANSHIWIDGSCYGAHINITGCTTMTGVDDNGGGPLTPLYSINVQSPNLGPIIINGNDLTGNTTGGEGGSIGNISLLTNARIRSNQGPNDYDIGQLLLHNQYGDYYTEASPYVTSASSATTTINLPPIIPFGRGRYILEICARGVTTGATWGGIWYFVMADEGLGAALIWANAIMGELGTAGVILIGAGAAGKIELAGSAVAADGSSFTLTINNQVGEDLGDCYIAVRPVGGAS